MFIDAKLLIFRRSPRSRRWLILHLKNIKKVKKLNLMYECLALPLRALTQSGPRYTLICNALFLRGLIKNEPDYPYKFFIF